MRVRIRLDEGNRVSRRLGKNRHIAAAVAALLSPAAVLAGIVALWRIAADLEIASQFAISSGFFSHWQVWAMVALLLQGSAWLLEQYARRHGDTLPISSVRKPANPLE